MCDSYYKVRHNLLRSVISITKCDKKLLQSVTGITKSDIYYKVRRNKVHIDFLMAIDLKM